jgi:signal transduction histidine kinase
VTSPLASDEFRPDDARLAALAEFAAGAGHEINNPLATIIGRAQQLLRDETDAGRRQVLAAIVGQAYRVRDMIGDVMTFARPPQPVRASVDLSAIVREVASKLASVLELERCHTELALSTDTVLDADAVQLAIVVGELVRNAAHALQPGGGLIRVSTEATADGVRLSVADTGRGFSEKERVHAFDPFFSGRQAGRGLGFGLCKVWQILQMHRGTIAIASTPSGPTVVTVEVPRRPSGE